MIDNICRGELYIADLNPYEGCEQGGIRPVLIVKMTRETNSVQQQ